MASVIDPGQLRLELKEWERDFAAASGRKPGKTDIKNDRAIAEKYKLYDKLTRKPAPVPPKKKKEQTNIPSSPSGGKRKRDSGVGLFEDALVAVSGTPRKAARKPSNSNSLGATSSDPYDPPLNEFFSPAPQRTYVGPTPQKNGKVLGLFDLLTPESARRSATPKKATTNNALFNALSPSKKATGDGLAATPSRSRMGPPMATPSKRLDGVLSPSRNKINAMLSPAANRIMTPSMQRAKKFDLDATPDFLKRRRSPAFRRSSTSGTQEGADEGYGDADGLMNISWSPVAVRQPRKLMGRSFSQIIRENQRVEEQRIEDELDILRDLEQAAGGAQAIPGTRTKTQQTQKSPKVDEPLGTDITPRMLASTGQSHGATALDEDLPLGPDGERKVDRSDNSDDEDEPSNPGPKRYKKKGPKRQTKKFNIRPTQIKWQPEPEWKAGMDSDEDNEGNNEVVPETQIAAEIGDVLSDIEDLASEYEEDVPKTGDKKAAGKSKRGAKTANAEEKSRKEAPRQKARKVSAMAHANYRTLRIKNKNSKGKKGGRFGRRRG